MRPWMRKQVYRLRWIFIARRKSKKKYRSGGRGAKPPGQSLIRQAAPNFLVSLAMLLTVSIFTCFLLPKLNRSSQIQDLRIKKSIEIIENDLKMDRKFNQILTCLELFHKDVSSADF